ncbi:MAG: aldo/keto reductase, partial [Anaerolineae bacterium]|nr:aldo/keto reductase [Anaerolineae bacterium]
IVISTKKSTWEDGPMTREMVISSLEDSLRRLDTDYVDIYHLHGLRLEQYDA